MILSLYGCRSIGQGLGNQILSRKINRHWRLQAFPLPTHCLDSLFNPLEIRSGDDVTVCIVDNVEAFVKTESYLVKHVTKPSWTNNLPEKNKNHRGLWLIIEQHGQIPTITLSQGECQKYSKKNTNASTPKDVLALLVESKLQMFNGDEYILVFETDEGDYPETHTDNDLVYAIKTAVKAAFEFTFFNLAPEFVCDRFITTQRESVIPLPFQSNFCPTVLHGNSTQQLKSKISQAVSNIQWLINNQDEDGIRKLNRVINESYDSPSWPSTYLRIWATMDEGCYGHSASKSLGCENWRNSQADRISNNLHGAKKQKKCRDELAHAKAYKVKRELFESLQKDVFYAICNASRIIDKDRK